MHILSGGESMSIGLATKGILPDYIILKQYVQSINNIEIGTEIIEVTAELISDTISVTNSGEISVEVEMIESSTVTTGESIEVSIEETSEIEIEVNLCR